jgi:hypothetical protein
MRRGVGGGLTSRALPGQPQGVLLEHRSVIGVGPFYERQANECVLETTRSLLVSVRHVWFRGRLLEIRRAQMQPGMPCSRGLPISSHLTRKLARPQSDPSPPSADGLMSCTLHAAGYKLAQVI